MSYRDLFMKENSDSMEKLNLAVDRISEIPSENVVGCHAERRSKVPARRCPLGRDIVSLLGRQRQPHEASRKGPG